VTDALVSVAALLVAVALIAYTAYANHLLARRWLDHLEHVERQARAERAELYRVLLSRTAGEFGSLDRIRQTPPKAGRAQMTREEYEDMLRDDMRGMGFDDNEVPLVPEGL
jgi:hypothetical protein